MKISTIIISTLLLLLFGFFGRSCYDYSLVCTRCLAGKLVYEQSFLGLRYSTSTKEGVPGSFGYKRIFGKPCDHVYHTGGFGRNTAGMISCGVTAEGIFFRPRNIAVAATFDVEQRIGNQAMAIETFRLIDANLPEDFPVQKVRSLPETSQSTLQMLGDLLVKTTNEEEWRLVLSAAAMNFRDLSSLPAHMTESYAK